MRFPSKETIGNFWADYFTQYPEPGTLDELNTMRRDFEDWQHYKAKGCAAPLSYAAWKKQRRDAGHG